MIVTFGVDLPRRRLCRCGTRVHHVSPESEMNKSPGW
jgi:hypothetical protein